MTQLDELRLMTKIARLLYEENQTQSQVAQRLGLSQSTISRLANRAREEGIVKITVSVPQGVHANLEQALIRRYGLRDVVVVDCAEDADEERIQHDIGAAAAYYVQSTLGENEVIGLSSWSATLLAMVDALHPLTRRKNDHAAPRVVQILGGVGNPAAAVHAARLTGRFADLVQGTAVYLPAPGIVASPATLQAFLADAYVAEAMQLFHQVTLALVGIGAVEPSPLLAHSGNIFTETELNLLRQSGAAGDILLRFFDENGSPVQTELNERVVSMTLEQLKQVNRAVGVAGGSRKYAAIRGALLGGWINVLVTDRLTSEWLSNQPE